MFIRETLRAMFLRATRDRHTPVNMSIVCFSALNSHTPAIACIGLYLQPFPEGQHTLLQPSFKSACDLRHIHSALDAHIT